MFRVVHTSPKRVLSHLHRLKREGEALLQSETLDPRAEAMWSDRLFRYLRKISEDPATFERLLMKSVMALSTEAVPPPVKSPQELTKVWKKHVANHLVTLAGAIEQFEAQYEQES
jgi:hypothetical protein